MTSLFEAETDLAATLQSVADIAVPDFADYVTLDVIRPDGSLDRVAVATHHTTPWLTALIEETRRGVRDSSPESDTPIWRALRERRSTLIPSVSDEMLQRGAYSPRHLELTRAASPASLIFAPLIARGTVFGVLQFCAFGGSRTYDDAALTLANDVAQRAAFAVYNARLLADREREIAERRAVEETLRASDALLRTIIDSTPDIIFARDRQGRTILGNRAAAQFAGRPLESLAGLDRTAVFGEVDAARIAREDEEILRSGHGQTYDVRFQGASPTRDFQLTKYPLVQSDGVSIGVVSVSRDVTEQRAAAIRIAEREQRVSLILDAAPMAMILFRIEPSGDLRVAEVNRSFVQLTGLARGAIVDRRVEECFPPAMIEASRMCMALALERKARTAPRIVEVDYPAGRRVIESIATPILDDEGQLSHLLLAAQDVEARERALRAVAESEERYRVLFDASPVPMWVYDPVTSRFLEVNEATVRRYGWSREEFPRMTMLDIRAEEDIPAYRERLTKIDAGGVLFTQTKHRTRDGTWIDVEAYGCDISFGGMRARLVYAADVSERRRLTEQLLQAQKTEAVGRLAGGIAHDFNNLLTVIGGFARIAQGRAGTGEDVTEDLDLVVRASDRAASLTRQLLAYSRRQLLQPQRVDANAIVREAAHMLRRTIREDIAFELQLPEHELPVYVDPAQLQTVLVNLVLNARDAMPTGGRLVITSSRVTRPAEGECRRFIALAVSDTGKGMDVATRERIFEPFFTTKEVGQGTGLGLATAYGIVTQSGGAIDVETVPGTGTTFTVFLPEADAPATDGAARTESRGERSRVSGVVLVAEDDPSVRALTTRFLRDAGYVVHAAASGEEALEVAASLSGLDILVADVIMPGISGRTLAERLLVERPSLRVLFVSGYTADIVAQHGILDPGISLLEKPFTASELLTALRSLPARSAG